MPEFVLQFQHTMLAGAALALAGLVPGSLSARFGIPFLLIFLVVGMLAGEDGPGRIAFDEDRLSFAVGNLALAVILHGRRPDRAGEAVGARRGRCGG